MKMLSRVHNILFIISTVSSITLLSCSEDSPNNKETDPEIPSGQYSKMAKLYANDGKENDIFGESVALDNNIAAVIAGNGNGVYIYKSLDSSWVQQAKITIDGMPPDALFWGSVALSGNNLIFGARFNTVNDKPLAGSAHIFKLIGSDWVEQAYFTADNPELTANFGSAVAIYDDYAAVGAIFDNINGRYSGSCYIYKLQNDNWVKHSIITPSNPDSLDSFGSHVSLYEDYLLVAANSSVNPDRYIGSVYIFHREGDNWIEQAKLMTNMYNIIYSVALSSDYAIVGARNSCYAYHRNGTNWDDYKEIIQSDPGNNDLFGKSVSLSGNHVIVGAPWHEPDRSKTGAAYVYEFNGRNWNEIMKLTENEGLENDGYGYSVYIQNYKAIVGAEQGDGEEAKTGTAYIYKLDY